MRNDIILIHEDKSPRQNWKLGRFVELIISKDNVVRAAKVIVGSRTFLERPINKLYPVEKTNNPCDVRQKRKALELAKLKIKCGQ